MRRVLFAAALLLLSAAPAWAQGGAAAAPAAVPTDLFLHLNGFSDFPVSTEAPPPEYASDIHWGLATHTVTCVDPGVGGIGLLAQEFHTWHGALFVGHVSYLEGSPMGTGYDFPLRLADVRLDPAGAALEWFLAVKAAPTGAPFEDPPPPAAVPRVYLEAEVRTLPPGSLGLAEESFAAGTRVAWGRAGPATLAGPLTSGATYEDANGTALYGLEVPLGIEDPLLPRDRLALLRIQAYAERDACPEDGSVMTNTVFPVTDAGHRPRLALVALDPVAVDGFRAFPRPDGPGHVLAANITDAWGGYDVANATFSVEGPAPLAARPADFLLAPFHCHCPDTPAQAVLLWPEAASAPDGEYVAVVRATTLQGHVVQARFPFTLGEGEREAPAPALGALAAALAGAAALSARRR